MSDLGISAQHIDNFKLAVEYKYLIDNAPGGVYLLPQEDNIRCLHGVIFVRRGFYRDGVFRFVICLPQHYNSVNSYPNVTFVPPIYHPLVDPLTGVINLCADNGGNNSMRNGWYPDKHFLITVLVYIKKLFYIDNFDNFEIDEDYKEGCDKNIPKEYCRDDENEDNGAQGSLLTASFRKKSYIENTDALDIFKSVTSPEYTKIIQDMLHASVKNRSTPSSTTITASSKDNIIMHMNASSVFSPKVYENHLLESLITQLKQHQLQRLQDTPSSCDEDSNIKEKGDKITNGDEAIISSNSNIVFLPDHTGLDMIRQQIYGSDNTSEKYA